MTDVECWKEQTAFERERRDYRLSGIVLLALEEPDMPCCLIAERFGETPSLVQHTLNNAGISREHEYFAASIDGRRRMVG